MKDRFALLWPLLLAAAACSSPHGSTEATSRGAPLLSYSAPRGGFVSATVSDFGDHHLLSVAATFWSPENAGAGVSCSAREVGRCSVRSCTTGGASLRSLTSGAITITADGFAAASLPPDDRGHYANPAGKAQPWAPGARIRVETRGGDVPAMAADLTAPPPLDVLVPAAKGPLAIDRATGFPVAWAPAEEGDVRVAIRQERTSGKTALEAGVSVDCFFARSDGRGVVPAEALTELSTSLPAHAMVYGVEQGPVRAGDFEAVVLVNTGGMFREATVR